jgi:TPR repeat protein
MYNLGQLYENGDGVRRDERVALNWYDRAAKNGIDAGVQRATALRRRLPASGGKPEMTQVALTMPRETSPDSGDQRNAEISAPIDLHQAEQLFALGNRYANGKGMARDDAKAVSLYKAAAAAGLAAAQNNLGFMYAEGRGVKRDDTEAAEWYRRAADQDYPPAITGLGMLYQEGRGVAQNYARALGLYAKASNLGYAQATANLGAMYGKGQGVALDRATAAFFMSMAKAQPRQGSGIYVDSGS